MEEISAYVIEILTFYDRAIISGIGMMLAFAFGNRLIELFRF